MIHETYLIDETKGITASLISNSLCKLNENVISYKKEDLIIHLPETIKRKACSDFSFLCSHDIEKMDVKHKGEIYISGYKVEFYNDKLVSCSHMSCIDGYIGFNLFISEGDNFLIKVPFYMKESTIKYMNMNTSNGYSFAKNI